MNFKHNKKRNTAFLFECLIKELTQATLDKNIDLKNEIVNIIKESFGKESTLYKELNIYKSILDHKNMEPHLAQKILWEAKRQFNKLDRKCVFNEQTKLINKINKSLSKKTFTNFVPSYKDLATIYQMFNYDNSPRQSVLLEQQALQIMSTPSSDRKYDPVTTDKFVYKKFVESFNTTYSQSLLSEQKQLLNKFISPSENNLELKIFLNEEIGRLKTILKEETSKEKEKTESILFEKLNRTLNKITTWKDIPINEKLIENVLKLQHLANEITK